VSELCAAELLGADGPFAAAIEGFAPREAQQQLAEAVEVALDEDAVLIGEAGTGVGKTYAYLVPAICSGKKVIVSTGTRHLQDQLFLKDLPKVREMLGLPLHAALLKGRANYLCRHRLRHAVANPALRDPLIQQQLDIIGQWAGRTRTGDISEVSEISESAMVWQYVTSNIDFCADHERDELDDCFVYGARREAQEAQLVVVNHHLFLADLAIKEEGFGEVLPSAEAFILDEAHQLPEVASNFFGERFTSRQLIELARDITGEQLRDAPDAIDLRLAAEALEDSSRDFRLAFGADPQREAWEAVGEDDAVHRALGDLLSCYEKLLA
jgi:ATP-dependent DNA helicase DinG